MKIDPDNFKVDETQSNPMVVAMRYPDCPINEICFFMAVGFGSVTKQCEHLKAEGEISECLYETKEIL